MNKLIKLNDKEWQLTTEDGQTFIGKLWTEKKKDKKTGEEHINYHVKLPDNPSGRQYVNLSQLDADGSYEFPNRTTEKRVMGWRDKLTPEEEAELKQLEGRIEEIKRAAMGRDDTVGKLEREIAKLMAELQAARKKNGESE